MNLLMLSPADEVIDHVDETDILFSFTRDPMEASDRLTPDTVLAYGEGMFGAATTGQPARLPHDGISIVIVHTADIDYERPSTALFMQAAAMLRVHAIIDTSTKAGRDALTRITEGTWDPRVHRTLAEADA